MVTLNNIYNDIKILAAENLAEKWDNIGIMVGDKNQKITKILICLDVTKQVVAEAIEKNVDLIISHHPLIFSPLKKINFNNFKGSIIRDLIKNDISVLSAHTNLDSAKLGLNHYLAKILELSEVKVLVENNIAEDTGLGRFGSLAKEMSMDNFITYIKNKLDLKFVKLVAANNNPIKKVAILGGSGGSFLYSIPEVDVYLTGDVGYHVAVDAKEMNINIIDIGHFAEKFSKNLFKDYFETLSYKDKIEVILSEVEEEPFEIR